jgi:hypothetical protein
VWGRIFKKMSDIYSLIFFILVCRLFLLLFLINQSTNTHKKHIHNRFDAADKEQTFDDAIKKVKKGE